MKQHKVCGYPDNPCDAEYDFRGICCCGGENENSCDCALLSGHFVSVWRKRIWKKCQVEQSLLRGFLDHMRPPAITVWNRVATPERCNRSLGLFRAWSHAPTPEQAPPCKKESSEAVAGMGAINPKPTV